MIQTKPFEVLECKLDNEYEINYLSKFKKFICRLFKITPEKKYHYVFKLRVPYFYYRIGDIILSQNEDKFLITDINKVGDDENVITIVNVNTCDKIKNIYGKLIILGNTFAIGTGYPISR